MYSAFSNRCQFRKTAPFRICCILCNRKMKVLDLLQHVYCIIFLIMSVRKVRFYIGNEESHLRELSKWDEDLLDSESVIYCGVEGHPSPNYTIWRKSRDGEIRFVIRDYFPYWENEDNNTRWAALAAADIEWGLAFELICESSLGNESISANIHFPGFKTFLALLCKTSRVNLLILK